MHGDVVAELGVAALELEQHGVHSAATLNVGVRLEEIAGGGLEADHLTELDLFLEGDLHVLELSVALGHSGLTLRDDELREGVGFVDEGLGRGDEVGLALQLDDGPDVALDEQRHDTLVVVTVVALGGLGETLLAQPLLRGFHVAVVGLEGLLGIHHPGAGGLAQ